VGYSLEKLRIIPHKIFKPWLEDESLRAPEERLASYQVVGEAKAHQAYDG
tara:strand:+ start:115 stop:264 length:150 start_codon:yes stop_codon:yes gene_type:complete